MSVEREGWFPRALLARAAARPPAGGTLACAVMLADVSGFTALTERLAERGPAGAERLTELLNARFGGIIETILAHGGDITHYAGDAIVAVWPAGDVGDPGGHARRASACAIAVQALPAAAAADAAPLRVRVGLAAGDAWWAILGGDDERAFVVGGAPVAAAGAAAASGEPGAVTVSIGSAAVFAADAGAAVPAPEQQHPVRDARADRLDAFLPAPLRRRLAAGEQWLAEFRRVTVLFASFGDAGFASAERLDEAQSVVLAAYAVVARFEGSVHQLVADGPGATLIAAWGLPQLTHEDDARRGVEAAAALERALAARGLPCAIGVATGRVFCGVRGNAGRREWAMLGDTMNLAARIMRAAGSGVLCDEETAQAAQSRVAFTAMPPVTVKGKSRPVPVFRPAAGASPAAPVRAPTVLVGRAAEAARIAVRLDDLVSRRAGGVLILEGEAGIGKSELLALAEGRAAAAGAVVARGNADAIENATAYFVWRAVLARLLAAAGGATASLGDDAALRERAPLLNDILALELPETALTAAMEPQGRADALRDLVAAIVRASAARAPVLVILDDAHWFDSASWAMTAAAARLAPQALFLIATRPLMDSPPPAYRQLLAAGAESMQVLPLVPADALALVRRRLQVDALPRAAETAINEKAQGNPFFSEQLALALRDGGLLVIEGRACRLATQAGDLRDITLPDTVQGAISGRIDRLAGPEQLTLKVASVIGRVFPFRTLRAMYSDEAVRPSLRRNLDHLTEIDLTRVEVPEPDLAHLFTHIITQQVAYDLMSFAQRRELHRALALWYETELRSDLTPYYPLLAHHWASAGQPAPAVRYLSFAATQALERFANEEVVRFIREARALAAGGRLDIDDAQRSIWELQEGEALLKLARYAESRTHFLESLRLLGRPVPRARARLAWRIAVESARQAARRMRGRSGSRESRLPIPERSRMLQAAHLHQRLAEVGYWDHDILTLVHSAVTSLNYAEPAGDSRELHLAHHVLGFVGGLAGSRALFDRYHRRADAVGARVEHIETAAFCAQLDAIYFNGQARWAEMHAAARRAGAMFERMGERFRWQTCVVLRAWGTLHQGDSADARALFEDAGRMVGAEGPTQVQVWSAAGLLAVELRENGRASPDRMTALEALLAQGVDHSDAIMCLGQLSLAYHRAGDRERALDRAARATKLIDKFPPASFHTLLGTAAVAEVRIAEWSRTRARADRAAARHAVRGITRFAAACPIGVPYSWLARAEFARVDGRAAGAARAEKSAIEEAHRLSMHLSRRPGAESRGP